MRKRWTVSCQAIYLLWRNASASPVSRTSSPALDQCEYAGKVDQVRRWIADGDCYQINLTFPISFRYFGHPVALYAALRRRQPVRYGACIAVPGETVLSFSPELFFQRTAGRVVARPMKGTAPRGSSAEEDQRLRLALLSSAKERAENIMIVDLLRNDLGRLARPGSVRVDSLCEAEAYPTLWQVVSTVSADLPDAHLGDIFRALFPCGSITGAPKIRAMQCIAELEGAPRGLYTGTVGG
jgi:para-aminobenzoate synthetase / 4-amino-4-deoxychorismate lyase